MFIRLKRKILLLNMALISVVMASAFAAVYIMTWRNVRAENLRRMDSQEPVIMSGRFNAEGQAGFSLSSWVSPDYSLSFSVDIDGGGNLIGVRSIIDLPRAAYEEAVRAALAQNRATGRIAFESKDWMYRITPAGEDVQYIGAVRVIRQFNGQILFLDITESRLTLRNLLITLSTTGVAVLVIFYYISLYFSKRAVKPVIEAWEKQKRFIADASHELKTPLTIISANCDALLESGQETVDSQRKWIDYIQAGTDRMTKLTRQLLTVARMDGANISKTPEDVNLSELALDVIRSMEAVARNITHSVQPDIVIKSDGEKISAIFTVLIDNAVKYSDKYVDVTLRREKRRVCFTVKNDGKGISAEDLPKIFDRFYRGDTSREGNESYGLGLSIAKTVAESLDGKIEAVSKPDEYTLFTVTLPAPGMYR